MFDITQRDMIKIYIQIFVLIYASTFTSCEDYKINIKPYNSFKVFNKVQTQYFDLDTLTFKIIEGNKGTKIWFVREDFELDEGDKVTVELKELYDFKDLVFNNINTITNKNELLESSGVIYLDFKVGDKSVPLKDKKRLSIIFPDKRLKGNELYYTQLDTLAQFQWIEEPVYIGVIHYDRVNRIDIIKSIPIDSLQFYQQKDSLANAETSQEMELQNYSERVLINKFKWINIDKVVNPDYRIDFELDIDAREELDNYQIHMIYKGFNSFISLYRTKDNLTFENIPIKNETYLIVTSKSEQFIYGSKLKLKKLKQEKIKVNLKVMDTANLRQLLEN
ncbi:hypothetical protein [Aquimarina intermedia]|uniref:Uncharacterized protein n=1 Tax=Aquimarina intermedia TaxID=350814 RepID=A0A5S5C211_9FLAO|nr:hypothetical protein [Aquimarina intermedia]TYP73461.1 hypothetical protein BD809_10548 [Aquimarina intermedia]